LKNPPAGESGFRPSKPGKKSLILFRGSKIMEGGVGTQGGLINLSAPD